MREVLWVDRGSGPESPGHGATLISQHERSNQGGFMGFVVGARAGAIAARFIGPPG